LIRTSFLILNSLRLSERKIYPLARSEALFDQYRMADHASDPHHDEGKDTPTPGRQPDFLKRIDSALGLQLADQTVTVTSPLDGAPAKTSPTSTEPESKPPTTNLRPGFFGAGGSM
jgi:hypothetical protein